MASFGFSASDLAALTVFIKKTYECWHDACGAYSNVLGVLKNFEIVIDKVYGLAVGRYELARRDAEKLKSMINECEDTVEDLNDILRKYPSLDHNQSRNWDRIRFGRKGEKVERYVSVLSFRFA